MKKFLAYLEKQIHPSDKKPLVQTVEIICENHVTLSQATEFFENETGQKVGDVNLLGATLVGIKEKENCGEMIINDNVLAY
ncbi:TPA: hypothetical protein ACPVZG_000502 [Vibrio parahaemolyticus]